LDFSLFLFESEIFLIYNPFLNINIMEHKLIYDEENDILVLRFKNDLFFKEVDIIARMISDSLKNKPYRQLIVVSGREYNIENRETREAMMDRVAKLDITNVAYIGLSAANRMIAKVMSKTGFIKLDSGYFTDMEDAVNWLKSKR
jgi:hypothetical protein